MEDYFDPYEWDRWAYEQVYGKESEEKAIGILEINEKFIGIACLVAKEVADKENFVRKFGLSFEKDVQWHAISSLLDHLSRSPKKWN